MWAKHNNLQLEIPTPVSSVISAVADTSAAVMVCVRISFPSYIWMIFLSIYTLLKYCCGLSTRYPSYRNSPQQSAPEYDMFRDFPSQCPRRFAHWLATITSSRECPVKACFPSLHDNPIALTSNHQPAEVEGTHQIRKLKCRAP